MPVSEMMTPERWRRVETVFQSALDVAPENRERFLSEVCAGDEVLRREVEGLIEGYEAADEFLEQPAVDLKQIAGEELPTLRLEDIHAAARARASGARRDARRASAARRRGRRAAHASARIACCASWGAAAWARFIWPSAPTVIFAN